MSSNEVTLNTTLDYLGSAANHACLVTKQVYLDACKPGDTQKTVQAAARSFVEITAIYHHPYTACLGALAASVRPEYAKRGNDYIEGAITGVWNQLSFHHKIGLTVVGIASATYFDPASIFTTVGALCAFKLGVEMGTRNLSKENIAAASKKAEEKFAIE